MYYERSPLRSGFSNTPIPFSPNTPNRFPVTSARTENALKTVHPDVSQVTEEEIKNWRPSQVAHWLYIAGYTDAVIEKFLINDITGEVLLTLQNDDLKELSIQSFGKRRELMASIAHLQSTMQKAKASPEGKKSGLEKASAYAKSSNQSAADRLGPVRPNPEQTSAKRSHAKSGSPMDEVSPQTYGQGENQIMPGESVSIVGIEQLLPKPHNCSKGTECAKYKRRQAYLKQLAAENPGADFQQTDRIVFMGTPGSPDTGRNLLQPASAAVPSVVASSAALGPHADYMPQGGYTLSQDAVGRIPKVPKDDNVRRFLNYQHMDALAANLSNLPRLDIPSSPNVESMTTTIAANAYFTPTRNDTSATAVQQVGPFSQAHNAPAENYRQGTPFSEMDVPTTAIPNDPITRDISQSVPPSMQYGNMFPPYQPGSSPAPRAGNTPIRSRQLQPLRRVDEERALTPIESPDHLIRNPPVSHGHANSQSSLASDPGLRHTGYMRKRKSSNWLWNRENPEDPKLWALRGTDLASYNNESEAHRLSRALEHIDVDDYAVACSSQVGGSKLTAAFKRAIKYGNGKESRDKTAFSFSLIPGTKEGTTKELRGNKGPKSHHFAVNTRDERIDWMRELMLAKALKKGRDSGDDVLVNGSRWV